MWLLFRRSSASVPAAGGRFPPTGARNSTSSGTGTDKNPQAVSFAIVTQHTTAAGKRQVGVPRGCSPGVPAPRRCLPDTPLSPFVHTSCQRRPNDQHLPVTAQPERAPNSRLFQGLRHTTAVAGCLSAGDTLLSLPGSRNRGAVPADQPPGSSAIEPEVRAKRSALFQSESEARTNLKTAFPLHLSLVDEPAGELAASRSTVDASSTDCRQLEDEHLPR